MSTPLSARWQPAQDELLRQSWGKMYASSIATQLGVTKGAVIGRADRLGLPRLNPSTTQRTYGPTRGPAKPRKRSTQPKPKRPTMIEDLTLGDMRLISIVELSDTTCHWPIGDPSDWDKFRYCGLPKVQWGGPYCSHHLKKSMMAFERVFSCA